MALEQVRYTFDCESAAPQKWTVRSFTLSEALSAHYHGSIELACDEPPDDLLGASCTITLRRGAQLRAIHGVIQRVDHGASSGVAQNLTVHFGPALAALEHSVDCRVFADLTAPEILEQVFAAGLSPYGREVELKLLQSYPKREMCIQYNESDMAFARRLLYQEGISYCFDHSGAAELLVLFDDNASLAATLPIAFAPHDAAHNEHVSTFLATRQEGTTGVSFLDQNWTRPREPIAAHQGGADERGRERRQRRDVNTGLHNYEGNEYDAHTGSLRANAELQRNAMRSWSSTGGTSSVTRLGVGDVVSLTGHPEVAHDGRYVITSVQHHGDAERQEQGELMPYGNSFHCVPYDVACRPLERVQPLVLPGLMTATVVGPEGEEVCTDTHGRVLVRFHWDPEDNARAGNRKCWIRVMQSWAGQTFGTMFLPRVGMEVVVGFLNGCAERPVVLGCAFNGESMSPEKMPDNKTRTTLRTRSTPGGDGYHELSFEDAAGREELYLRSQRDMRSEVLRDNARHVGRDEHVVIDGERQCEVAANNSYTVGGEHALSVTGDASETYEKNLSIEVTGNLSASADSRQEHIAKDQALQIDGSMSERVDKGATLDVGEDIKITSGASISQSAAQKHEVDADTLSVTAKTSYRLEQGKASIVLRNGEVHIEASKIKLNGVDISIQASSTLKTKASKTAVS